MNQWIKTAQWVSHRGQKTTMRNDPFAHSAVFILSDGRFDYQVTAHSSPYATSGQSFILTVKHQNKTVCRYSYPDDIVEISIGNEWLRE